MITKFASKPGFLAALESSLADDFGTIRGLVEVSLFKDGKLTSLTVQRANDELLALMQSEADVVVVDIDAVLDLAENVYLSVTDVRSLLLTIN